MKQCDYPVRWLFKKSSVVHLERMHLRCVKNQSHWPALRFLQQEYKNVLYKTWTQFKFTVCAIFSVNLNELKEHVRWSSEVIWGLLSECQVILLIFPVWLTRKVTRSGWDTWPSEKHTTKNQSRNWGHGCSNQEYSRKFKNKVGIL